MLAAIAIPEQLATARLAGFPPEAGLYAFAAGTLAVAVFGTNRYVSVGADSTTAPIVAATLGALATFGGAGYHDLAAALALAVGIILVIVGVLRAGWVADLLSVPVTTGFLAGISAHIVIGQLPSLLGIAEPSGPLLERLYRIVVSGTHVNAFACALGIGVAALMLTAMRLNERIPGALIGLAAAGCAVAGFNLRAHGVDVLGDLHPALPALRLPPIPAAADWGALAPAAVIVAAVCALQTSVVVRSFPSAPDVEAIDGDFAAVGFGSMLAAFAGTFPVNASPPRTAIVTSAGGRSQAAGLVALAAIAIIVALCSRAAADVPQAALAGVLIVIGIRLFRLNEMRRIARCSRREIQLVIVGALLVIVLPIQTGMLLAIMLSLAHGVSLVMWPPSVQLFAVRGTTVWWPATGERDVVDVPGILVFAPAAPVNFTNAPFIRERLLTLIAGRHPPATLVVIEASAVSDIDYTGSQMLQAVIRELRGRGIEVAFARLIVPHAQQAAQRSGLIATLGAGNVFLSVQDAIAALAPHVPQNGTAADTGQEPPAGRESAFVPRIHLCGGTVQTDTLALDKAGLKAAADAVLEKTVAGDGMPGVPGVIAMATDRTGTIYEGAAGKRDLGGSQPMTLDTVVCIFSCTKAITGVAVMQLVEDGTLRLDDAAKTFVPDIADIRVLDGFDADGKPKLRPPKSDITVGQLLLHTAGFGYDFFNHDLIAFGAATGTPSVVSSTRASIRTPLLFDPGTQWEYGCNIDWAGLVVEGATGKKLGDVMRERIFTPLGMSDTGFRISPAMRPRRATIHQRSADGTLAPLPDLELPQEPELEMGGHALYATVGDYMKFIRMILNDGAGPNGRVLKPETVALMSSNALGAMKIKPLPGAIPSLSHDAEFFPGMPKSWGYTFMINDERAPTGRPAGALGWAGLANLFYWIDRENGVGGFWATQILPFIDPASIPGYLAFETTVYDHLR